MVQYSSVQCLWSDKNRLLLAHHHGRTSTGAWDRDGEGDRAGGRDRDESQSQSDERTGYDRRELDAGMQMMAGCVLILATHPGWRLNVFFLIFRLIFLFAVGPASHLNQTPFLAG